jgi:hypothetical protein
VLALARPGHGKGEAALSKYGLVSLAVIVAVLSLASAGYRLDSQEAVVDPTRHADESAMLTGEVLDPDGRPAAGVAVGAAADWLPTVSLANLYSTFTDEAGLFRLWLTTASGRPFRRGLAIWAHDDGRDLMGAVVIWEPPDGAVQVRLAPAARVRTSVVDLEGQPVPGFRTRLAIGGGSIHVMVNGPQTGTDGTLVVGPLPPAMRLRLQPEDDVEHLALDMPWRDDGTGYITLDPGESRELPALVVDPDGLSVEGIVEDAGGRPVAGARVAAHLPVTPVNATTADGSGAFKLDRLAVRDDVWLIASHPTEPLYAMQKVEPEGPEPVRIVLQPPVAAGGFLTTADGRPFGQVKVRVERKMRRRGGLPILWNAAWIPQPDPVVSDEDGAWAIDGLVAGAPYLVFPQVVDMGVFYRDAAFIANADGSFTDVGVTAVSPLE